MISDRQQEAATLYVLGVFTAAEKAAFEESLHANPELCELVRSLERTTTLLAKAVPPVAPPPSLRARILSQTQGQENRPAPDPPTRPTLALDPAFFFIAASDTTGWKQLPVPGAFIKLLSADRERGFAVVLGRLERGVRYPAHQHYTPEDIFLLTGDLTIAGRRLGPGDFHHCDAGTSHPVNYSEEGCTLLAVLSVEHDLAKFAMA